MMISNIVETMCFSRHYFPVEIKYDKGSEFLDQEFKYTLIQSEFGIKSKPEASGNYQSNYIIETIHQDMGNFIQTYNP